MSVRRVVLDLLYLLLLVSTTRAGLVNVTIDDTYGDLTTGQKPVYQPSGPWQGPNCNTCDIEPSAALAFDGTWTAATYSPSLNNINITFSFTGIEIWVFFILANVNSFGAGVATNCNFTLDGNAMGSFNHVPDMSTHNLQYNATVFSTSGLSNTQHTLVISTSDYPNSTFINFDYAIYTMNVPDNATLSSPRYSPTGVTGGTVGTSSTPSAETHSNNSSNSKLGVIIGSVLGSITFVVIVALLILFRRRLGKKRGSPEPIVTTFNQQAPQSYLDDVQMRGSHLPWQGSIDTGNLGLIASYDQRSHFRSPSSDVASESTMLPIRRELFSHSTKNRDELRAVRQMEINLRLQSAQQEMQNLTSRQLMNGVPNTSSEYGRQETEHEMGTMREQIREIRSQIEQLQVERSSDWAQGLSNQPPPAYH